MSSARDGSIAGESRAVAGRSLIALLAVCTSMGPIATNLFLPALPSIRAHFAAPVAATQTMLTAYLVAFAIALLLAGPISDRFGRRPLMLGGMAVFALGSLASALAPTLPLLVGGRIVQALGTAAALTVARAVVGDLYQGPQLAQRIATLTMVMVVGTTISPFLGGVIAERLDWQGGFWVLLAAGVTLAVVCWRWLPETRSAHAPVGFAALVRSMRSILAKPAFFAYAIQTGVIYAVFLVFIAAAPYVLAEGLGRSPSEFGLYYVLLSVGYFFGNLQVSKRAHLGNSERATATGLWVQFAFAALALAFVLAGLTHPLWMFGAMMPLAFGQGLALPHITAKAVSLAPGLAGAASSLIGFTQQAIAALSVQAMGWAPTHTAVPALIFCTAASALALVPLYGRLNPTSRIRGVESSQVLD